MSEELKKWHTKLALELSTGDWLMNRLHRVLAEMKNSGMNKDEAYELLASLRKVCTTGDEEDTILDLMDVVSGHCLAENRIWD